MTIQELRKGPHLSASSINDYTECSLLYKLSRIDKKPPAFTTDSLAFGSAIHEVIAVFQNHRKDGLSFTKENMLNSFEYHWHAKAKGREEIRYKGKNTYDLLLMQGMGLISVYYDHMMESAYKVIAVEEPFTFTIERFDVPIVGIMDLVEQDESGTIIISDIKTSKVSFSDDKIDKNFQLTLYHMAMKADGFYDREILLKLDTLIKTKKPRFESYYTVRTEKDETRAIKKITAVWEEIQKEIFVPNDASWRCRDCAYQIHCAEWFKQ